MYHYVGAVIADHLLAEQIQGRGILWDGITNVRFAEIADLLHEIQKYQQLPYVNSASFHAGHAILWQYISRVYPNIHKYPSQLADTWCRSPNFNQEGSRFAPTVSKGIDHECYHGFGHAMFYTVAKRQMKQQIVTTPRSSSNNSATTDSEQELSPLPNTTPSLSARLQVRPNSGFELTEEAMCQVHDLCKGAARSYDGDDDDEEDEYPFSRGVRVCLEGVVHSVRLFSATRHKKREAIDYVMSEMQRCENGGQKKAKSDKKNSQDEKKKKKTSSKAKDEKATSKANRIDSDTDTYNGRHTSSATIHHDQHGDDQHDHSQLDSERVRPPKEESHG